MITPLGYKTRSKTFLFNSNNPNSNSNSIQKRNTNISEMASIDMIQTFNPLPPSVSDHQQQQQQQQLHVLAVDDSIIDRKVIERLLKISSCKVTAVDSGRRALQLLGLLDGEKNSNSIGIDGLKVNMIITDYWMPGMTGYELMKKIKESSNFKEIPVVIMSSENVLPRINRCLEEGAEEFLVKPVQLSDVKRLKNHLTSCSSSSSSSSSSTREGNDLVVVEEGTTTSITNKRKLQVDSSNDVVVVEISTTKTSIESPSRRIRPIDYTDLI